MSAQAEETAPEAAPAPAKPAAKKKGPVSKAKPASAGKKKKGKGSGKYSQLVIDAIQTLGERNGSSLFKIYNEAKKVSWFDQQHGRTYLRYSIRALLQNDTLLQVKGLGANGSFRINKKKLDSKRSAVKPKKTAKPDKKPSKQAAEKKKKKKTKKKSVKKENPKKEPAPAKKTSNPKKAHSRPAVSAKKASKSKT